MQKHDLTFSYRNISSGSGPPTTSSIRSYGCLSPRSGRASGGSVKHISSPLKDWADKQDLHPKKVRLVISSTAAAREVMQKHDLTFSDRNISSGSGPPTTSSIRSYGCLSSRSGGASGGSVKHISSPLKDWANKQDLSRKKEVFSTALLSSTVFSVDVADAKSDTSSRHG
ncbi:hypothetical protein SAY86_003817 [Trapa natans]|uniref:Uncharacterized protein n=1 Tax=Trapa natans TaxID=22666 RepID=A0AAN7MDF6_TRANT|nr:hypothetical protein SAY86_003817 [Trapa natans]